MQVSLLAISRVADFFNVTCMTSEGTWVRPIPGHGKNRFWTREELTHSNGRFVRTGDIWEIKGRKPRRPLYSNYAEDFIISRRIHEKTLPLSVFLDFIDHNCENEHAFLDTIYARGRSVCMVKASEVRASASAIQGKMRTKMKVTGQQFDVANPFMMDSEYIVKDCKWEGLIKSGVQCTNLQRAFVCIGLAPPINGVQYPQILGFHSDPDIVHPASYPD